MTSPDKKYIAVDRNSGETFRFNAEDWANNQKEFMTDFPDAEIVEYDAYKPENLQDNDTIFVDTEDGQYTFTPEEWKENEEEFRKDFKTVNPTIARGYDYHYNSAKEIEGNMATQGSKIADWEQRRKDFLASLSHEDSAKIDQLDIQKQSGVQGMPLNENDPIVAQYNALMAEGDELKAEQDRLRGEYEANPRVKTAMEEWAKEYAQYKAESIDRTRNEIAKAKEEGVDLKSAAQAKIAKAQSMSMTGAMSAHTDLKGLSELQKLERLESANYFLDMAQDAKDGKMNGFWKGMKDVGSAFVETIKNRGDIANYVDIFNIMKKLEEKVGNLKNITDEEIDNNLTESERLLLKSYFEYADAIANADTDWKYKAGQIGGEGIKFAIEFALTAGASGAVSSAVTKGLTDGIERWAMKAIGNGAKKWLVQAAEKTAIGATRGALNVVLQTALRPSTYAQMAQKSIEIDEYGHLNGAKNSAISFIDSTIETLSEMSGDAIGKLLGFIPMKGVKGFAGKMFDKTLGMTKFGQYGKALLKGAFGDYLKAAGFHGAPIEMLEEVVGSALREMTIDDKAFEESFGGDNKYAMALGFLPMTFMGGAFSMAGLGASQIAAKNASSALATTLANYKFADGRIKALTDYQSDMSPLQMQLEAKEIISELKNNGASEADIETVNNYMTSKAGYLAMRGAKSEQDAEDRANVIADMESQYGDFYQKKDGMNEVTVAVLNDGRRVFVTSEKNENGEFSAIDQTTGKGTIINESDIKTIDTPIGISQQVITRMSLDEYASNAINERMQLAEIERMSNERNAQIAELSRLLPKAINLGTTGEPNMVAVKSQDQKGVTVVDAEGNEAVLSWDEVGMKMGAPIKVLTDAQIAEAEAAEIGLSRAERRAQRAKTEGQANAVDAEVNAINEEVKDVTPAPEEAYTNPENGLVDEDAFWEGDPEGFCDWNDRLNNDGGQDSREQIESSLIKLQAKMDQTRTLAMDEPKARRAVKAEMQKLQERIDRLTALQQKYAEMAMTEEQKAQERAELVLLMRERVNQWRELLGLTEEDLVVYESLDEVEDQNAIDQIARAKTEGWYSGASKRAFLFLPDITSLDELDAKVMHEVVTHYGLDKVMTPEAKNQLLDTVWGMMSDAARRAYLSYPGVNTLNGIERQRAAANEFMAKVAESVKVGNASAEQKGVWQRIVDFFNNLFKKVNAFFNGADVADFVLENYRLLANNIKPSMPTATIEEVAVEPEIAQSEVDTQVETILNESGISLMEDLAENVMAQAETMTNEEGLPIASNTNDGTELFSTTTAKPWTDNLGNEHKGTMEMVLERMQQMEFSEQEIRQMEAKMQTAYDYMMKLQSLTNPDGSVRFEEFNAWAEKTPLYKQVGRDFVKAITSLVSNGDYPINLELTTDCIKREAFTMLLNELVKRGADLAGMGPAEIVTIQKMMKQYGIQVACALCFVEGKRLQIVNWASQIVNDWNDALIEAGVETDEMFEFGKDGDAFIPSEEWRTYEDKPRLAKVLRTIDEVARIFQGVDPKVYKAQKAKNESALKKYIKEKEEAAAKKGKKWTPTDEQKREMKKIKVAGLTPTYVNENMKEYTAAFEQMRNEWVAKSPKKGPMRDPLDFTPTKTQWDELEKIRNRQIENVKQKMVRLIMEYPEMRKKMTLNDLLGSKGLMEIRQQHGVAYEQLYSIILQRFGTGTPKPVQDAVPYDGEVMTLTESAFKAANKIGGARLFSFSDFDITKVFDYMQMFFDLEANRQMLQSYTKEVAAVLLFGKSNAKFNISTLASAVVPAKVLEEYENASEGKRKDMRHQWAENAGLLVDENGTITGINFSEEHSVSPEFAQQIFHDDSRNKDCGAIMVGASVNHAIYSAAQAWIRMVIPFHLSGMPIAARDKTDVKWWTDNTEYQSTRKKTKDGWSKISDKENTFEFYADMHQEGWNMRDKAREYLDWCKDNAFRPKFDWGINSDYYRAYCEENGYTPNQQIIDMMDADTTNGVWNQYYKFLTDFTAYKPVFNEEGEMIDEIPSPQQRVISNFDMSEMEKQVIFEGENSMLARREGNIALANQHVSELADRVTPYLNGQITEEEMGLRDDVFYDARKDANAYLEATGNLLYSSTAKRRARKQLPEDLKMKEVVEKYGGIWIGNRQEYAKFVSAVNNWYFEKDGIGLVYADIHHMYQYYWNENGEPIPFRKFYISDSTRERIDNLIEQENEQRAGITVREITSENYDFVKNVEANAEGSTLDNTSVPMPLGDDNMAEDLLGEGAYANNPELYVTSSRPHETKILFSTSNRNQAIFVSNAAKAVEGIKQEKATPEQWLKMIEKNGGLKAGEDKWMGLSDWLKASDKKTLTKAEVLDFINENMIVIEEQHYSNEEMGKASVKILNEKYQGWEDAFSFEWDGYMEEPNADISNYEAAVELYNKHHDDKVALDGDGEFENMDDYEKVRQFGVELSEIYHGSKSEVRPIDGIREQYTTQGLQHLHEIALTVPTIESWNESDDIHFGDAGEGRAVAWIRFGDASKWVPEQREDGKKGRTKKVLVIDEIQSKRHQEGRDKGYKSDFKNSKEAQRLKAEVDRVTARLMELVNDRRENEESELTELARLDIALDNATSIAEYDAILEEQEKIRTHRENREAEELAVRGERRELAYLLDKQIDRDAVSAISAVPDAPFDKNWHELAMKRMLRYAAENGYDAIAWTKGEQQAERYNIGNVVDSIEAYDLEAQESEKLATKRVIIHMNNGSDISVKVNAEDGKIQGGDYDGQQLSELVGKEFAIQLLSEGEHTLNGQNLRIGGEGMEGFYDKMLPAFMNKYGKKWGVKVEDIHLNLENGLDMHSVPVTDEMKESVMEGQLMFSTKSATFESAITPEVRKEMDVISAQAIVNGNYLLAPNGQPTKLTPEQWALVRTQNFINWFGDWINDPENASKVIDENGEPMVVYHGTAGVINKFEDQQRSPGFWFVDREDVANGYAESAAGEFGEEKNVIPVFLNLRNPRIEDAQEGYPAEFALRSYVENDNGVYEVFDTYDEAETYRQTNVPDGWVGAAEVGDQHDLVERAKELGHDGVIMLNMHDQATYAETRVEGTQTNYVVLDANQIKSATENNGEFSESEDIRFSTRQPYESAKAFIQTETDKFYETYNTTLPAKVVYANSRKMIAEALGYKVEEMPDALYKAIREEAKQGYACVVSIDDKTTAILVFPREDVNQTAKVSRILFHENTHPMISDKPELLDLGKWLIENPVGIAEGVAEQVKSQYAEEDWDEEMVCDYIGAMLSLGRSQEALDVVPEEYKPLLNYVYERFGYKPESEDPRRRSERLGDARELQMRNSENEGGNEGNSGYLFSTTGREKSVEEIVEEGKQKVSAEHTQTVDAFMDRIRRINGNLQQLRMAAAAQREYDQKTVKTITDIANDLLEGGALNDLTRGEIKRLLSIINGGVGKSDLTKSVNRLMDLMVANQLRYGKSLIEKFLKIRGSKVDQRGVEVRGTLDIPGQQMLAAFKEGIGLSKDKLADRIAEAEDALSSDSETKKRNAENELVGFYLAKQYHEDINDSIEEEKDLRNEIKVADEDYKAGKITKEMHKQLLDTIYEAILENRIQRVNAYEKLASDLGAKMVSSIKNAGLLRDAEKERVQKIQHFANSDMQGMPADMHGVKENRFWNSPLVRFFLKPLATFDQMLRSFAPKSTSGEGYLWNHFMGGWTKATESEYKGVQEAHEMLDSAARTMFGEGVERWSDLFAKERKMPKIAIKVWDNGEMVDKEISQGNALYIYMVNKMTDGKMKLRKMGISQEDVDAIVAQMDPRFITLADWMQERFLPSLRDKYNAVHERLFGAPMASIDNYFPIKVNPGARTREVDVETGEGTAKPATITGSIIKRTKNSLALDIMNADAFDVMLEHIQQMEHWAAFAEFNKDLNTLLSYRKFRNRVENMSGIYGSGKTVWSNFKTVAEIAAGVYQPASKSDSLDKTALNVAKGVTGAKISFRVYTAIKQLLSMPAFVSDANIVTLAKNIATPWIAWNWAMENLPMFEKRWKSRQAGDTRLMQTDSDWKVWKSKIVELAGRYGMTPNAFIDAITVSIGARSIYETKYQSYLDMGYSEEQADKKAKQDATVLFNESQQSNESAFLSAVQVDRTVASVAFTVFRNSAMGYQRMAVDAWRNISHMMRKGYKEESIEYMKKQMVRDGLTEEQAERAATRVYNRSFAKNAARLVTFQFLVQFAWNLGAYLPYLLVGDDDDEKKAMVKDAAIRGLVGGPIEGMAGGSIVSNMAGNLAMGEKLSDVNTTLLPVISDIEKTIKMLDYDKVAAYNEMFNILIQSGIGVNPQTFTDIIVAIEDACNGEPQTSKEVALCIMRALQVPQSQLEKVYFDEIDFTVDKGLDLTIEEFAKRYANYKVNRGTPLTGWMYEDEVEKEREDKYIKRFLKTAEELKRSRGNEEAKKYYEYLDTDYKETTETINGLKRKAEAAGMKGDQIGAMEYAKMLDDFMKTDLFKDYVKFGGKAKAIESIRDKMKKVDMQTRESLEDMMLELRKEMVQEMEEANR